MKTKVGLCALNSWSSVFIPFRHGGTLQVYVDTVGDAGRHQARLTERYPDIKFAISIDPFLQKRGIRSCKNRMPALILPMLLTCLSSSLAVQVHCLPQSRCHLSYCQRCKHRRQGILARPASCWSCLCLKARWILALHVLHDDACMVLQMSHCQLLAKIPMEKW